MVSSVPFVSFTPNFRRKKKSNDFYENPNEQGPDFSYFFYRTAFLSPSKKKKVEKLQIKINNWFFKFFLSAKWTNEIKNEKKKTKTVRNSNKLSYIMRFSFLPLCGICDMPCADSSFLVVFISFYYVTQCVLYTNEEEGNQLYSLKKDRNLHRY